MRHDHRFCASESLMLTEPPHLRPLHRRGCGAPSRVENPAQICIRIANQLATIVRIPIRLKMAPARALSAYILTILRVDIACDFRGGAVGLRHFLDRLGGSIVPLCCLWVTSFSRPIS